MLCNVFFLGDITLYTIKYACGHHYMHKRGLITRHTYRVNYNRSYQVINNRCTNTCLGLVLAKQFMAKNIINVLKFWTAHFVRNTKNCLHFLSPENHGTIWNYSVLIEYVFKHNVNYINKWSKTKEPYVSICWNILLLLLLFNVGIELQLLLC